MTGATMMMSNQMWPAPLSSRNGTKRKGGGDKISAQPVMEVTISKPNLDES